MDIAIQDDGPFPHIVSLDIKGYVRVWSVSTKDCYLVGGPVPDLPTQVPGRARVDWHAYRLIRAAAFRPTTGAWSRPC